MGEKEIKFLKVLTSDMVQEITTVLGDDEICMTDILAQIYTSQSNVSRWLSRGAEVGIFSCRSDAETDGRFKYYRVEGEFIAQELIRMGREYAN